VKLGLTGREKASVVMKEFYRGTLRHGSTGEIVTDPQVAKAIAVSEGHKADVAKLARASHRSNPGPKHMAQHHRFTPIDEQKVEALILFADNTGELYEEKKRLIAKMAEWMAEGRYDAARAPKLWAGWVAKAARMYAREFPDEPHNFSRAELNEVARQEAEHEAGRVKRGEHGANPMAHAKTRKKTKARRSGRAAPHERSYKPRASHHSTAHMAHSKPAHKKRRRRQSTVTVSDTHRIPAHPSATQAVANLHKAIDHLETVETELLTVRAALRPFRKPKKSKAKRPHKARGLGAHKRLGSHKRLGRSRR
jgi:hypothetical protein